MRFTVSGNVREKIRRIQANLQALPEQIANIGQDIIDEAETEVLALLTFTPPTPRYPAGQFPWTSEKQRRAYFATDGFGNGIPYRRKGNVTRGWRLFGVTNSKGVTIVVQNEWDAAKYVYGGFTSTQPQQRFHHITGWTQAQGLRNDVIDILIRTAREVISRQAIQLIFD